MSRISLPDAQTIYEWGNSLARNLPELQVPIPPKTDNNWWKWANLFISVNKLTYISLADRRVFKKPEDWRKWAWLFIKNYNASSKS